MADSSPIAGKTALVTGAGKRLGEATSLALADSGVHVVAHYRGSQVEAELLAERIRERGVRAWTVQADLSDPAEADGLFQRAREVAGDIQILINNASIFAESHLTDFSPQDLAACIEVNALAPLLVARRFVEALGRAGTGGAIVNFLDCRIADYDAQHVAYHLSKRMSFSLTRMMAVEFAPAVQVNAVAPGLILPPAGEDVTYLERLAGSNPLNRYGSVDEITAAVLFLLRSRFITGQVIFVDGGRHLKGSMYG